MLRVAMLALALSVSACESDCADGDGLPWPDAEVATVLNVPSSPASICSDEPYDVYDATGIPTTTTYGEAEGHPEGEHCCLWLVQRGGVECWEAWCTDGECNTYMLERQFCTPSRPRRAPR